MGKPAAITSPRRLSKPVISPLARSTGLLLLICRESGYITPILRIKSSFPMLLAGMNIYNRTSLNITN